MKGPCLTQETEGPCLKRGAHSLKIFSQYTLHKGVSVKQVPPTYVGLNQISQTGLDSLTLKANGCDTLSQTY